LRKKRRKKRRKRWRKLRKRRSEAKMISVSWWWVTFSQVEKDFYSSFAFGSPLGRRSAPPSMADFPLTYTFAEYGTTPTGTKLFILDEPEDSVRVTKATYHAYHALVTGSFIKPTEEVLFYVTRESTIVPVRVNRVSSDEEPFQDHRRVFINAFKNRKLGEDVIVGCLTFENGRCKLKVGRRGVGQEVLDSGETMIKHMELAMEFGVDVPRFTGVVDLDYVSGANA